MKSNLDPHQGPGPAARPSVVLPEVGQPVYLKAQPANPHPIDLGMGFNWFDHLGVGGYYARWENYPLSDQIYPDLADTQAWAAIEKGLDELGLDWLRFGLPPDVHVDPQGNFVKGTVHLRRLQRLNAWACKNGKTLLLDPFLMPRHYEFPLPAGVQEPGPQLINMAATDNKLYAYNFVAPLFKHIVHELKLESVRYFNPINEPMEYGVYQTPQNEPPVLVHYVEMYREIRAALDAQGIDRERVGLIGIDGSFPNQILLEQLTYGVDIDPYLDAYAVHHYDLKLDYLPSKEFPEKPAGYFHKGLRGAIEQYDGDVLRYTRQRQKPLWALEMGTFYYGKFINPEGVASLDATLTVSEGIIRALNMGITTFCIWSLMNPNTVDGHWAVMGQSAGKLVKYKYPFAFYGLLGTHMPARAQVYPLKMEPESELSFIHATALENEEACTILLVNDHPSETIEVEIALPSHWSAPLFEQRLAREETLNEALPSVAVQAGTLRITCPPFGLIGLQAPR